MVRRDSLLLVDLQNDFCKNGALAVPDAEAVIPVANKWMKKFEIVIATQDWHPKNHASFKRTWPIHCVQQSHGAAFHPALDLMSITKIIQKGVDPEIDSYSAFYDNSRQKSTGLADYLHELKVTHLTVMGLATDYCVYHTCLDAVREGFSVLVVLEGCRGIEKHSIEKALKDMHDKGVHFI